MYVYVCVYVCMYVCMCVYVYVCVYVLLSALTTGIFHWISLSYCTNIAKQQVRHMESISTNKINAKVLKTKQKYP